MSVYEPVTLSRLSLWPVDRVPGSWGRWRVSRRDGVRSSGGGIVLWRFVRADVAAVGLSTQPRSPAPASTESLIYKMFHTSLYEPVTLSGSSLWPVDRVTGSWRRRRGVRTVLEVVAERTWLRRSGGTAAVRGRGNEHYQERADATPGFPGCRAKKGRTDPRDRLAPGTQKSQSPRVSEFRPDPDRPCRQRRR